MNRSKETDEEVAGKLLVRNWTPAVALGKERSECKEHLGKQTPQRNSLREREGAPRVRARFLVSAVGLVVLFVQVGNTWRRCRYDCELVEVNKPLGLPSDVPP